MSDETSIRHSAGGRTFVKCCGMFRREDIAAVNAAMPDYCGFIVDFPRSHRSLAPEQVIELTGLLSDQIEAVGVFVDHDPRLIAELVRDSGLETVQLHGHESDAYIDELRTLTDAPIIKAFKVRGAADIAAANASHADLVLLDNGYGTGAAFDWTLLGPASAASAGQGAALTRPFILAGGLTPENIPQAIERFHPYAVDISSGIETDKLKNPAKIHAAVQAARRRYSTPAKLQGAHATD